MQKPGSIFLNHYRKLWILGNIVTVLVVVVTVIAVNILG